MLLHAEVHGILYWTISLSVITIQTPGNKRATNFTNVTGSKTKNSNAYPFPLVLKLQKTQKRL